MVQAPLQIEARYFVPVALAEGIREAAIDGARGIDADQVETLRRVENAGDDLLGMRHVATLHRAAGADVGCIVEVRVVGQVLKCVTQRHQRAVDIGPVMGEIAGNGERSLGVTLAANQAQREVALRDGAGLPNLAAVHAHEIRNLRIEAANVDLARRLRTVEQRNDVVEIGLHRRCHHASPPKTSTLENTHAGEACPTRMTCDGSPLPQNGVPSTCIVDASPTCVRLRQKLADMPR